MADLVPSQASLEDPLTDEMRCWAESTARVLAMEMLTNPDEFGLPVGVTVQQAVAAAEKMQADGTYPYGKPPAATPKPLMYRHDSVVYYMRMDRLVKIGVSTNIRVRVDAIMPQGVMAVEWGSFDIEHARHRQFVASHSHGEWFQMSPELVKHIHQVRESFLASSGQTTEEWLTEQGVRA